MSNQLISNLERVTATVTDPFLRQHMGRVFQEMDIITTEVLPVGQTRSQLPRVRRGLCEGGALLVADRGVVGNPQETTVMMSLATLNQMLVNALDRSAQLQAGRTLPSEMLTGLIPVPAAANLQLDLGETALDNDDRELSDVEV